MAKRAKRLHHEERIKEKFRKVAKLELFPSARKYDSMSNGMTHEELIEHHAVRMAHHPRHQCVVCKEGKKYEREEKRKQDKKLIKESE